MELQTNIQAEESKSSAKQNKTKLKEWKGIVQDHYRKGTSNTEIASILLEGKLYLNDEKTIALQKQCDTIWRIALFGSDWFRTANNGFDRMICRFPSPHVEGFFRYATAKKVTGLKMLLRT